MENRLEKMGNELTTMLGFENETVIAYWQAFEGRRFIECEKIYHDAFQGLTFLTQYDRIIIEREVMTMKINFGNENVGTPIRNICVGETFFTQRKSIKERGLYMKSLEEILETDISKSVDI